MTGSRVHIKTLDVLIFVLALLVIGLISFQTYFRGQGVAEITINGADDQWIFPLDGEATVTVPGPLGDTVVAVRDGSVHVLSSPCPEKICIKTGRISKPGQCSGSPVCPTRFSSRSGAERASSPMRSVNRRAIGEAQPRMRKLVALAAAICLFLASIEYVIPKPLPFLRIGLANLPLLLALDLFPISHFFILLGIKILGQSLIQGSLFSFTFLLSLSGSLASGLLMLAARRILGKSSSLIGISILGALASNLVQLTIARYLVFGSSAWMIAPPFLLVGLVSSSILGYLAQAYKDHSLWLRKVFPSHLRR
jgi:heptaprenyl diphosphate synthase